MEDEGTLDLPRFLAVDLRESCGRTEGIEEEVVELYLNMRSSLLGYAYQLVGRMGDAEDLVQEAFLKVFDQCRRGTRILNVQSWVFRVVHNLAVDQRRRERIQQLVGREATTFELPVDETDSVEDLLIRRQSIDKSLDLLNERERHCMMLRAEGLTYSEIGDVLAISAKAVSVYLARGVKKFEARDAKSR